MAPADLVTAQITKTEAKILALFRQELAEESAMPAQWKLSVSTANGQAELSSQFERIDRVDLRGEALTADLIEEWVRVLVQRQIAPIKVLADDWNLTIEVNADRIRAHRSRRGAKTLPKAGK